MPHHFMVLFHVVAAILLIGPVAVSTSQFASAAKAARGGDKLAAGRAQLLYKMTKTYGLLSLIVPLLGFGAFFTVDDATKNYFIHTGILLTLIAWALLFFVIIPKQKNVAAQLGILDADEAEDARDVPAVNWDKVGSQLSMFSGIFNLLWVVTAILMFFRP